MILTTGSGHYAVKATYADIVGGLDRCREFGCSMRIESEDETWIEAMPCQGRWRLYRGTGPLEPQFISGYDVEDQTVRIVLAMFLERDSSLFEAVRWEPA